MIKSRSTRAAWARRWARPSAGSPLSSATRPRAELKRALAGAFGVALLFASRAALASDASLTYDGAEGCPDAEAFWAAFSARSPRTVRAPERGEWSMRVRVTRDERFHASLELEHHGQTLTRVIDDVSCDTATTALAVVAALTVDAPPPRPPHTEPEPEAPPAAALAPAPTWHLRVGASGALATAVAPTFALGGLGWLELWRDDLGMFAPRVRLGFQYLLSDAVAVANASAGVESQLIRLELGGPRLRLAPWLEADVALLVDAGRVVGEGRGLDSGHAEAVPWLEVGGIGHLRATAGRFSFETGVAPVVPITRPRFVFQPGPVVVFDAPAVGVVAEVGAGVRLF